MRTLSRAGSPRSDDVRAGDAGSWIYIGTQGILQGTIETITELSRQHFGGTLKGRLVLTANLGGMGGFKPLAVTMNEGVVLCVEADPGRIERWLATRYLDWKAPNLEAAVARTLAMKEAGEPYSIGLEGNAAASDFGWTPGRRMWCERLGGRSRR